MVRAHELYPCFDIHCARQKYRVAGVSMEIEDIQNVINAVDYIFR
jgi:hypothetical protein